MICVSSVNTGELRRVLRIRVARNFRMANDGPTMVV